MRENRRLRAGYDRVESENKVLRERIAELVAELAATKDADKQLALGLEIKVLQERLDQKNREEFGSRSERRGRPEDDGTRPKASKPGKKRGRSKATAQAELPMQVTRHAFDDADLCCPRCAHTMRRKERHAGYSEIGVRVREYFVDKHEVEVACCGSCGFTESADTPPKIWSKTVTKGVRKLAFAKALTERIKDGDVSSIDSFNIESGKTKDFVAAIEKLTDAKKVLVVGKFEETTFRAGRNVQKTLLMSAEELNAEHLLHYDKIFLTDGALEVLARRTQGVLPKKETAANAEKAA